ncbi:MAG: extracellular solute-binding protein [Sphaerochaetaceae bacterium]|nr:extracellular solute-binding protein [Sphaerochaetaceae bacterium]
MKGRRKDNVIACTCVVLVCLFAFISCGKNTGGDQSVSSTDVAPVNLVIWNYYIGEQKKAFDAAVAEFNATVGLKEKIVVESVSKSDITTLNNQVAASANNEPGSEPLPDMFFAYSDIAYVLAEKGLLESYDAYVAPGTFDLFVPGFVAEGKILDDGKTYILPVAKSTEVITINKTDFDIFMEAVDADSRFEDVSYDSFLTWEGIVKVSQAYYEWTAATTGDGKALFGIDSIANFLISSNRQLGVELMTVADGKGTLSLKRSALEKIWDTYYEPMVRGWFAAYGRFRSDDVKNGDLLAYLGSNTSGAYFPKQVFAENEATYPIDLLVMSMPVYEGCEKVAIQQGAGVAMIKSDARKAQAAAMFLLWFSEPDLNIKFATMSSYIPVRNEAIGQLDAQYAQNPPDDRIGMTLERAISQVASGYDMYAPRPYSGSYELRLVLENVLKHSCADARAKVLEDISVGVDYETAVRKQLEGEYFENFIKSLVDAATKNGVSVCVME